MHTYALHILTGMRSICNALAHNHALEILHAKGNVGPAGLLIYATRVRVCMYKRKCTYEILHAKGNLGPQLACAYYMCARVRTCTYVCNVILTF